MVDIRTLSDEFKQSVQQLYGERLSKIILYGSHARGDFGPDSDVDYLVVLKDDSIAAGREICQMAPLLGRLSLEYETEVSVFPTNQEKYQDPDSLFYRTISQEGIEL